MGGASKELWILIGITVPFVLVVLALPSPITYLLAGIQIAVVVYCGFAIWNLGGKIISGMTRIYEDATRVFGPREEAYDTKAGPPYAQAVQQPAVDHPNGATPTMYCVHCGSLIPTYATFCKRCGKKQ